jgi:hypothetical protein|tara:strand:- start:2350 stop:3336 length:987 start_codon:yes stop_codon:yes gene_type:complete
MFEYFYNEIFRSVIIAFGSIFNGIEVRKDSSVIKVPLAYGPTQKFLARMQQDVDLNRPTQITLPRMSFEFLGLQYDPTRKMTQTQTFAMEEPDGTTIQRAYLPVPYNMSFELSVLTKLNDDMLQITEQIIPYFQPTYTIPIKFLGNLKEVINVPIQLDSIEMEDDYEGNFDTRRALIYTLRFTAKTYVYGPIADVTSDIIKKVQVGYIAGTYDKSVTPSRDLTYSVVPRATKDYDGVVSTLLSANVNLTDTIIEVDDGTAVSAQTYIYIDQEEIYIEAVSSNKLTVRRAQDNTTVQNHVLGAQVKTITDADDNLIEVGDDFGFDGSTF